MIEPTAVFVLAFLSSAHCIGMCGGFAAAIGATHDRVAPLVFRQAIYSVGRVFTYAFLGACGGYAGLFFSLCVDVNDNELALLEAIHLFVEVLDHYFSNVCELDLVFNFHKVYQVIDEFILAGEIQETSKKQIMERLYELEKIKD